LAQYLRVFRLLDDRHGYRATLVTSQLPVKHWHEVIGEPSVLFLKLSSDPFPRILLRVE
jgi:hypothetical protein